MFANSFVRPQWTAIFVAWLLATAACTPRRDHDHRPDIYSAILNEVFEGSRPAVVIQAEPIPLPPSVFPNWTRVVPTKEIWSTIGSLSFSDPFGEEGWGRFHQRFGATSFQAFSVPIVTADLRDAIVYYEFRCGGLCGAGEYWWLHRGWWSGRWSTKERVMTIQW